MSYAEEPIEVVDRRKHPFILIDKPVVWGWLPYIKATGFSLYAVYVSLVNHATGFAFPSIRTLEKFTGMSHTTIIKYNEILEQFGLIQIERIVGENGEHIVNRYYILDVPPIPEDLGEDLRHRSIIGNIDDHVEIEGSKEVEGGVPINGTGGVPINGTEVDKGSKETKETTTTGAANSSDTPDTSSGKDSRCDVVVVENEPKSIPNPDPNPPGEAALDASPGHSSDNEQQSTPIPPGDNRGASEDSEADPPEGPEMVNETIEELRQVGICICLAGKFVQEYGAARCAEVLGALKGLPQRPENPAGWVRKALEQEWIVQQPDPPAPQDSPAKQDLERVEREQLRRQQEEVEKVEEERRKLAEASPYRDLWEEVKEKLSGRIMPQSMASWFSMCYVLEASEGRMVLSAPSKFKADWIVENYEDLLEEITGREVEVVAGEEKMAA